MSQMKKLMQTILELHYLGLSDAEIARRLQLRRDIVQYCVDTYAEVEAAAA